MYLLTHKSLPLAAAILSLLSQPIVAVAANNYAYFDTDQQRLVLPETNAGVLGYYALNLSIYSMDPIIFELNIDSITPVTDTDIADAVYNLNTGQLSIPAILVDSKWYSSELQQLSIGTDYRFSLSNMINIPDPSAVNTPASIKTMVVDTGQTLCYGNNVPISCPEMGDFFGQDAQYAGTQAQYTDNDNGTVTDNITGLVWMQTIDTNGDGVINVSDKFSISNAEAYVAGLNEQNYAGYNDWRVPSIKEQYSLMDFRGTDPSGDSGDDTSSLTPFIDNTVFGFNYGDTTANERVIDAQYASSTRYISTASDEELLFGVNFADGRIKGYGLQLRGVDKTFYVQPVRGEVYGENQFVDNGNGTISDKSNGLMWRQDDSGTGMNWQQAFAWVVQKNAENHLGHNDWRLPNVKELQIIVDYSRSPDTSNSASINPIFNATVIQNEAGQDDYAFYWSSTTHAKSNGMGANGAYVAFGRSLGYMDGSWRDVHGAGSQRSDPKAGDASEYPTGFGPQGDAIRINNYVRLVRGGVSDAIHTGGEVPEVTITPVSTESDTSEQTAPTGNQNPPQEAVTACASLSANDSCSVQTPQGQALAGICQTMTDESLACVPENPPAN